MKRKIMTISEFAKATEISRKTVATWASKGIIPGAALEETLVGAVWAIPESAAKTLAKWKPSRGRPKGAKNKPKA